MAILPDVECAELERAALLSPHPPWGSLPARGANLFMDADPLVFRPRIAGQICNYMDARALAKGSRSSSDCRVGGIQVINKTRHAELFGPISPLR